MRKRAIAVAVAVAMGMMVVGSSMAGQTVTIYSIHAVGQDGEGETKVTDGVTSHNSKHIVMVPLANNGTEISINNASAASGADFSVDDLASYGQTAAQGVSFVCAGFSNQANVEVKSNFVTIGPDAGLSISYSGGTAGTVVGGFAQGTDSDSLNNVVILQGEVGCETFGGRSDLGYADSNTVVLDGGTTKYAYGGFYGQSSAGSPAQPGKGARFNAVIWKSGQVTGSVYGGQTNYQTQGTVQSNTFAIVGAGKEVKRIGAFQNYVFALDAAAVNGTEMLKVTGSYNGETLKNTEFDLSNLQIAVTLKNSEAALKKGDSATLISLAPSSSGTMSFKNTTKFDTVDSSIIINELKTGGNTYAASAITEAESKVNKYGFDLTVTDNDTKLKATVSSVSANAVTAGLRNVAYSSVVNLRNQMNDVALRMGELRNSNSDGAWTRVYGGKYSVADGASEKSVTLQIGADKWFDANSYVGMTASYTKADDSYRNGSNDQKNWNVGFYYGYVAESGLFMDAIVKHGQFKNDFNLAFDNGTLSKGKYNTYGTSLSLEGGWRFNCPNTGYYVEPQAELMYGHLQSASFEAAGVKYDNDAVNTLVGRLGVATGYQFAEKKGAVYFKASLVHDFKGEVKTRATFGAETDGGFNRDLGGTWGEFGLGGTYKATQNLGLYGEMKCTTKAAGVRTKWQGSAGVRYTF